LRGHYAVPAFDSKWPAEGDGGLAPRRE